MSHTNVSTNKRKDDEQDLRVELLQVEVNFWRKRYEWMRSEMENIPKAVKEWGYVDIDTEYGGNITLVDKDKLSEGAIQ